jgi:uncharacterized protein (DUF58 family)
VPARPGRINLQALLHRVVQAAKTDHEGASDLAGALRRLQGTAKRRGLVVVISDFLAPEGWQRPLQALALRHEVLAVEVVDRRELELPDVGIIDVFDPETGDRRELNTGSARVREAFAAEAAAQRTRLAKDIRSVGADHLVLRTDSDWLLDLVRFVSWRRERIDALGRVRR